MGTKTLSIREVARRGGIARARSLSPERRREIACKAIRARWGNARTRDRATLLQSLREILPDLKERFDIVELRLFGSHARNEGTAESDIDLLATYEEPDQVSLLDRLRAQEFLSTSLGAKVDLGTEKCLREEIADHVLAEAVMV